MVLPMHFPEALAGHMRVNLRGADARMPQELLNYPQIRAMFEQVRGKAMPQHVRRDVALEAGAAHPPLDAPPQGHMRKGRPALSQEYIRTARAKGLPERVVVVRHALKNAYISVVTMMGLQMGRILGGTVIVETVFARRGIGSVVVNAILQRDFPLVQGAVLFVSMVYVMVNLGVDLLYGYLDPRIRFD